MDGETKKWGVVREDLNRLEDYVKRLDALYTLDSKDLDSMVEALKEEPSYPKEYFHWALELARARAKTVGQVDFACIERLGEFAASAAEYAFELYYRIALMKYGLNEALKLHPLSPRPEAYFKAWQAASKFRSIAWEMTTYSGSVLCDVANVAAKAMRLEYAIRVVDNIDDDLGLLLEDYLKGSVNDEEIAKKVEQELAVEKPPLKIADLKKLAADVEECLGPEYVLPAIQLAQMIYAES
ncbi:MAG: hypothetical protein QW680_13970 [Pyrobaculum sp.]